MQDNEKLKNYCLTVRNLGRFKYSLRQGIPFGVMIFLVPKLFDLTEHPFGEVFFSLKALLSLVFAIVLGITIYGSFMWWINERTLKKLLS